MRTARPLLVAWEYLKDTEDNPPRSSDPEIAKAEDLARAKMRAERDALKAAVVAAERDKKKPSITNDAIRNEVERRKAAGGRRAGRRCRCKAEGRYRTRGTGKTLSAVPT